MFCSSFPATKMATAVCLFRVEEENSWEEYWILFSLKMNPEYESIHLRNQLVRKWIINKPQRAPYIGSHMGFGSVWNYWLQVWLHRVIKIHSFVFQTQRAKWAFGPAQEWKKLQRFLVFLLKELSALGLRRAKNETGGRWMEGTWVLSHPHSI